MACLDRAGSRWRPLPGSMRIVRCAMSWQVTCMPISSDHRYTCRGAQNPPTRHTENGADVPPSPQRRDKEGKKKGTAQDASFMPPLFDKCDTCKFRRSWRTLHTYFCGAAVGSCALGVLHRQASGEAGRDVTVHGARMHASGGWCDAAPHTYAMQFGRRI